MRNLLRLFCLLAALGLTACNTIAGIGKDLQKGGEYIENKAAK